MTLTTQALFAGSPRFPAHKAHKAPTVICEEGPAFDWRSLFDQGVAQGLATVQGPFAVALPMDDGSVVLAVDRFGVHTLCYRMVDGQLHWAMRADDLAGLPGQPEAELQPQALFDYLYFHTIPSPQTAFTGVQRLQPGHWAHFANGQLTVAPYWTPRFSPMRAPSFDTLRDEFRQLLRSAVQHSLGPGRPACFLSGGTDSSTVAGLLAEVTGNRPASYSIGFDAEGYDEMAYARLAAKHFGTDHHEYYVTPADIAASLPRMAASFDQPFGNSSVLPAYHCALQARQDGITQLLAGDGGDELFGGNARYAKQRVFGWYAHLPAVLRGGLLEPLLLRSPLGGWPGLRKGRSYVEQAQVPMPDRLQMYNLLLRLGPAEVLEPGFLHMVDAAAPLAHQQAVWNAPTQASELNRMLAFDWRYTLAESDLPKVNHATGLAGVSVAYPLLDDALLAFSERLPDAYKLKGLKLRWFFKEALRGFLPDEILTKKKHGFGLPFGVWAHEHEALRQLVTDSLGSLSTRGIVRPAFTKSLLQTMLPQYPGYYGEMVWILVVLELWLQAHLPGLKFDGAGRG